MPLNLVGFKRCTKGTVCLGDFAINSEFRFSSRGKLQSQADFFFFLWGVDCDFTSLVSTNTVKG